MVATDFEDWGDIGELPPLKTLQERINTRYDNLFHWDSKGNRHPYVCTICNEFILFLEDLTWLPLTELKKRKDLLRWDIIYDAERNAPKELQEAYRFNDIDDVLEDDDVEWMKTIALSPRGVVGKKNGRHLSKLGFSCCHSCKSSLSSGSTPFNSIANRNYVGHAPQCLKDLTPVELSLISPVKGYGYCFSYSGGAQMKLQGCMTFMRVQERASTRALAQLEAMGVSDYVVVLLNGKMTASQKQRAQNTIRVDKLMEAVEWLKSNNVNWKDCNLDQYREEFKTKVPIIVDNSSEEESTNENIETKELFKCYFPDGSLDENLGGFASREAFKEHVDKMAQNGNFDISVKLDLEKEFANDDTDIFVSSGLLQFPYGLGGLNEMRLMPDTSLTEKTDIELYIKHLNRLSEVEFQEPMFQLISYSMICKLKLIRRSRLQVRGKHTAETLANGLSAEDVRTSIRGRAVGNRFAGTTASRTLLKAVDACSQALPHTNEASRQARSTGEAMQHYLGRPGTFVTATLDDENSFLMQVMHGKVIDTDENLKTLSDDALAERSTKRKELRLKFPGIAAKNFQMLFNIIVEEVFGWSIRKNRSTGKPGLFGICEAMCAAYEEQGRTTVHAHASAWIKGLRKMQDRMFFGTKMEKRDANALLSKYHERVVTTEMIVPANYKNVGFDHVCPEMPKQRGNPCVIDDQQLRNLRHKKGFKATEGLFAVCPTCSKGWTAEQLLNTYIKQHPEYVTCLPCKDDVNQVVEEDKGILPKARMFARIIQFQKKIDADVDDDTPVMCINAAYQHHSSCHVRGCFKCNKLKIRNHKCGPTCECRFRLPDRARKRAEVRTCNDSVDWYYWNGASRQQPLVEFLPKRSSYDQFQNASCKVISESKMSCNSNVSIITDGPLGQYQFKYQMKGTQEDDSAPYKEVETSIKSLAGRSHEDDKKEAVRVICRAAFAHNKKNVIGPAMASFINENGERFYFSHDVSYCPLRDIVDLLNKSSVPSVAKYSNDGTMYFENQALHYLCRSKELENCSVKEFYETYYKVQINVCEKKRKRGNDDSPVFSFIADTGHFQHPSAYKRKQPKTPVRQTASTPKKSRTPTSSRKSNQNQSTPRRRTTPTTPARSSGSARKSKVTTPSRKEQPECKQGVKEREKKVFIKVSQWMFPDSAKFKNDILECPMDKITNDMEIYAQLVLALLLPHRCLDDLKTTNVNEQSKPFTARLREVHRDDKNRVLQGENPVFFKDENLQFLQNIQDCAYNSMRYKIKDDDLQSVTEPFTAFDDCAESTEDTIDEDEDEETLNSAYAMFMEHMQKEADPLDENPSFLSRTLKNMNFRSMRTAGKRQCGFNPFLPTPKLNVQTGSEYEDFVKCLEAIPNVPQQSNTSAQNATFNNPGVKPVVELLFQKTVSRAREQVFKHNKQAKVPDANGTVTSINEWAEAATLDNYQKRAFQSIAAAFVLTFFDTDAEEDSEANVTAAERSRFRRARTNLLTLKGGKGCKNEQLIMLLHGPGGSGKSTVINLSVAYCREYVEHLIRIYILRCIIITAMSGVAATLIHGETTHAALYLNHRKITDEMIDYWMGTRLIFVDEISFATGSDFEKMDHNLQVLSNCQWKPFGGKNIVFSGDYSQLEPPQRTPIYKGDRCHVFFDMLNAYIELDGMHRFSDDLPWGRLLSKFRAGEAEVEDVRTINSNCLVSETNKPPTGVQVACYTNKERDAVNCATFEQFCETYGPADGSALNDAILIFMDSLEMRDENREYVGITSNSVKRHFWTECGEDRCRHGKSKTKRIDPVLKLYPNCPLMMTENKDVPNGQANGSRTFLQQVSVKPNEVPMEIELACGTKVRAFLASQIQSLTLKHETDDILPPTFDVTPESFEFTATMFIEGEKKLCDMKGRQLPLSSNTATTGHKLQGYTALCLLVNDWFYGQNWPYVVLSRVRTMKGLFLNEPLSEDVNLYRMPEEMKAMLREFRQKYWLEDIDDDIMRGLLNFEKNNIINI